jgi:hypothetical protein
VVVFVVALFVAAWSQSQANKPGNTNRITAIFLDFCVADYHMHGLVAAKSNAVPVVSAGRFK